MNDDFSIRSQLQLKAVQIYQAIARYDTTYFALTVCDRCKLLNISVRKILDHPRVCWMVFQKKKQIGQIPLQAGIQFHVGHSAISRSRTV